MPKMSPTETETRKASKTEVSVTMVDQPASQAIREEMASELDAVVAGRARLESRQHRRFPLLTHKLLEQQG